VTQPPPRHPTAPQAAARAAARRRMDGWCRSRPVRHPVGWCRRPLLCRCCWGPGMCGGEQRV